MKLFPILYKAFTEKDMSMLEINPLIVMENGHLRVLDAKVSFPKSLTVPRLGRGSNPIGSSGAIRTFATGSIEILVDADHYGPSASIDCLSRPGTPAATSSRLNDNAMTSGLRSSYQACTPASSIDRNSMGPPRQLGEPPNDNHRQARHDRHW
mgnify:CR=1 FL=1